MRAQMKRNSLNFTAPLLLAALGALLVACGDTGGDSSAQSQTTTGGNPPPAGNSAPQISGNPPSAVVAGQAYAFTPSATDGDGDSLTFSVMGLPTWASFNPATGRVSGTPGQGDLGNYTNIRISVTDGQASASLSSFSIEVVAVALGSATLSWNPPTQNTDGSALTLDGYKLYWGTTHGNYTNVETIGNNVTTYMLDNLAPNTYYFVMTALDNLGNESDYSNEATKTVM